ncbi:hypothetical protein [Microbacterium atlanticum]|uniref:hypothetical protein n=1 Tax=Microbacterium atlanticum TaxID=2782168 RepID=UPI001E41118F|nr:hypothetical protein [Microbacterium atlanticum]
MILPLDAGTSASRLQLVAGALSPLIDRMTDAASAARGLADDVDWQAEAAQAFHERAVAWAGDVSGLACLAETVRLEALRARDRAAFAAALPGVAPTGDRR